MPDLVPPWTVEPVNAGVARLLGSRGLHVGNFKRINGVWKFKAIGYDVHGSVMPGGGPLTDRHNTVLTHLDPAALAAFLPDRGPSGGAKT